jgi:hypothetical protein
MCDINTLQVKKTLPPPGPDTQVRTLAAISLAYF